MYLLVSRVPTGLAELRNYLNEHIHSQGSLAIDKCGDQCANVRLPSNPLHYITLHCHRIAFLSAIPWPTIVTMVMPLAYSFSCLKRIAAIRVESSRVECVSRTLALSRQTHNPCLKRKESEAFVQFCTADSYLLLVSLAAHDAE